MSQNAFRWPQVRGLPHGLPHNALPFPSNEAKWLWNERSERKSLFHGHGLSSEPFGEDDFFCIVSPLYGCTQQPSLAQSASGYSVTWRPTSSLSPCATSGHLFAQGRISVFVFRYTWYECADGSVCRRMSAAQMRFYTVERLSDERSLLGNRLL